MGYIKPIHDVLGLESRIRVLLTSEGQKSNTVTTIGNAMFASQDAVYTLYRKPSKPGTQYWCTLKTGYNKPIVDDGLSAKTAMQEGEFLCRVTLQGVASDHNTIDIFDNSKSWGMYGNVMVTLECPNAPEVVQFSARTNAKKVKGKSFRGVRGLTQDNALASEGKIAIPILTKAGEQAESVPVSSRKIYRHSSNEGSVIEFDYWGTTKKLFVADAKYRPATALANDTTDQDHGLPKMDDKGDWRPQGSSDDRSKLLTWTMTDKEWQDKWPQLRQDGTAKSNTDRLMQFSTTQAAHHCRNQNISGIGALDLPNIYELFIMYMEADRLDAMDPTFEQYKDRGLGCKSTNGRFYMHDSQVWSSSEYSNDDGYRVCSDGQVYWHSHSHQRGVAPVKELNA